MEISRLVLLIVVLLTHQLVLPVASQTRVQVRRVRPNQSDKCDRRCSDKDGYTADISEEQYKTYQDKVITGGGRPGVGVEHEPKLVADRDVYDPKPVVSNGGSGSYKPKPTDERGGYDSKPVVSGSGGQLKPVADILNPLRVYESKPPVGSGMGGHSSRPITDRVEYDAKPPTSSGGSGGYKPRPVIDRTEYDSKPPVSSSGSAGYKPRPVADRDEYEPKPIREVGREYDSKPVVYRDEHHQTGSVNRKPAVVDDYKPVVSSGSNAGNRRPAASGGGYIPRPTNRNEKIPAERYEPKPGQGGRETRPCVPILVENRDGYVPKPVGNRDEYVPKPVEDRDEYIPKPVEDRDVYVPKPVEDRDEYIPKPIGDRDEYIPKPVEDRGEYIPKPIGGTSGGGYIPKPVGGTGGGGNIPKPIGGTGGGGYIPKPVADTGETIGKPVAGEDGPYRRPDGQDFGGYDSEKDNDYNVDYPTYDVKDDDYEGGKPLPVVEGNCICVPYYQCTDGHIVTDGAGIIDARKRPDPDAELPLDGKFKPPSCGPFHVCCNTPESSTVRPYEHRCGVRNPSGINSRILSPSNKGEADFGEWPWQAAVLKAEGKVNIFQCGGVLVDKYHVITVAHCVYHLYKFDEYPLKVRLGEWDTQTTTEFLAHADYKVSKILIHPEYRNSSLWNDIAILRLEDPVFFAPHIDTVCLPQYDEIFAGQNCVVTGWGKDAYKGGTFSNVMKEVALQVIDNYQCEEMLRKTRLGRFFELHEGFLCAGGEYGLDSCKGDGGGPLVCYRKDRSYALAGIVSWGIDCGQPGVPGVYVKIQKYLDWISKSTGVTLEDYWPRH